MYLLEAAEQSSLMTHSELWIIVSNFLLVFATLFLCGVSIHEEHKTIRTINKANNKLIRKVLGLVVKNKDARHRSED